MPDASMSQAAVRSGVASLCRGFWDARKLLSEVRRRRIDRRTLRDTDDLQMDALAHSLDQGAALVRDQYDHSLIQVGGPFAEGDQDASNQLSNIATMLQQKVVASLKLAFEEDLVIDLQDLLYISNDSRVKAVLCLLGLHHRMLANGLLMGQNGTTAKQVDWEPSGYKEAQSHRESPLDGKEEKEQKRSHTYHYSPRGMHRFTNAVSPFPPPQVSLPTPPPSADVSRRNTDASETAATNAARLGAKRSPTITSNEHNTAANASIVPSDTYPERPSTAPAANQGSAKLLPRLDRPPLPHSPIMRPKSPAGSYATTASNEKSEVALGTDYGNEANTVARRPALPKTSMSSITSPKISLNPTQHPLAQTAASVRSGTSSIYSVQQNNPSIPGADQRNFLPSEKNKFQGLCKSAWRLQTGQQKKAMKCRQRLVTSYGNQTVPYWSCATCDFQGKLIKVGKEDRFDSTILEVPVVGPDGSNLAVRWRWSFLFRSHYPMKKSSGWDAHLTVQQRASYGCLFCCALGKTMQGFTGVKALIEHLAAEHVGQGRWPRDEVLYRMNCIVGERAPESADWDINLVAGQ